MLKWLNLGLHLKLIEIISPTGCSKEKSQSTTYPLFLVFRSKKLCKLLLAKNA